LGHLALVFCPNGQTDFLHALKLARERNSSPKTIVERRKTVQGDSHVHLSATFCPSWGINQCGRIERLIKMQLKVLVIDKVSETFDTKKGSKTLHLLVCQDQSRPPLRNTFDYEMTAEELAKYGATLIDKPVELLVRDMTQNFSGRIRTTGAIGKVG
jgi:hypothetical protein